MKEEPLVSVIMSTLNTDEQFLKEAINSILNQSYRNLEFIIIVDGGEDDLFIKNNFNDYRIKIYKHKKTMGLPASLNEAIKYSKGKYVVRMDSDDISLTDRIRIQINYMENHGDIDICSTYYKNFGDINKNVKERFINSNEVKSKLFFTNIIAHPSVVFRKSSIEKYNLFYNVEYTYSQDFEMWNRKKEVKIGIIPRICLKYRVHSKQIGSAKKNMQNSFYYRILTDNLKKIGLNENYLNLILILNGRKKSKNYKEIDKFIKLLLEKNKEYKLYNQRSFNRVLKRQYLVFCVKNHCYNNFVKYILYI